MNFFKKILYFLKYQKVFNGNLRNVVIDDRFFIESKELVDFGKGIYFGTNFYAMNKGILTIEDNVIFAPNVSIVDYNHDFTSVEYIPYSKENLIKPVTIEKNVWVGLGVIILPGTYIEEGVIIGAGSVVNGRLEKNHIYAGNPVRKIKPRVFNSKQKQYMIDKLGL